MSEPIENTPSAPSTPLTESEVDYRCPQPVEGLWFEDGNLVIKTCMKQFKVFRGILAAQSTVFADMLSFPQPENGETIDGCPVVELSDDDDVETEHFLRALFDSAFFADHPFQRSKPEYSIVAGVLRLSHKYDVSFLRKRALLYLSSAFPTSSDTWQSQTLPPHRTLKISDYDTFDAISLAREVGAIWILPAAMYYCNYRYPISTCVNSFVGNKEETAAFFDGREKQNLHRIRVMKYLQDINYQECTNPVSCRVSRNKALSWLAFSFIPDIETGWNVRSFLNPLHNVWDPDHILKHLTLCNPCMAIATNAHEEAEQEFWSALPGIYGLPSWGELDRKRKEDLDGDELDVEVAVD